MLKAINYVSSIAARFTAGILITGTAGIIANTSNVFADGLSIDKIYHPYVQPLEHEIEFRGLHFDNINNDSTQLYRLGLGKSFTSNWFTEVYIIGAKDDDAFEVTAYELEAKVQLTEQGEFNADWGLLFEVEKATELSIFELAATLLVEREWGRTVGTTNIALTFETGDDITNELELSAAAQLRYRYSRALEPAIEFYFAQDTLGIGPTLMGEQRFGIGKKLHWELGVIAGLSDETPDTTLRALLEFEF